VEEKHDELLQLQPEEGKRLKHLVVLYAQVQKEMPVFHITEYANSANDYKDQLEEQHCKVVVVKCL